MKTTDRKIENMPKVGDQLWCPACKREAMLVKSIENGILKAECLQCTAEIEGRLCAAEVFTWNMPDGTAMHWNIETAKQIAAIPPRELHEVPRAFMRIALAANGNTAIDPARVPLEPSGVPIICVEHPMSNDPNAPDELRMTEKVVIVIDGWHRIMSAYIANLPLYCVILTEEEDKACRVNL